MSDQYHLHLETRSTRPKHFHLTEDIWNAAARRHPDLAKRLKVTIGWDGDIIDEALKTADFAIDSYPPKEGLRRRAPKLAWIQTIGAGIDALLPLDWLPEGITITNNRGAHGHKAEDSCTMALLAIHSRLPEMIGNQHAKQWRQVITAPIAGATALVVGFGDLGQAAGRAAAKLGLRVVAVTRSGRAAAPAAKSHPITEIDSVLPLADFLVVAIPTTPDTRGLIDRRRIGLLKRGAGVVNIGRAALMDYAALRERLENGDLAGAVLDVFDEEPLPPESPWWTARNVIVLPHVSCDTPGYAESFLDRWFANFERFLAGKPLENIVDRKLGY